MSVARPGSRLKTDVDAAGGGNGMKGVETMRFKHYPLERLMIESIASRLTPDENACRLWLMEYTIDRGIPYNIDNGAGSEPPGSKSSVRSLAEKRAIVVGPDGNVNFIYPVSALTTQHKVRLSDGRSFWAMCAVDALGASFTFKQDIRVESSCIECGEPIHVETEKRRIARLCPESAHVLHVDLNKIANWAASC